tara:strand:- start:706 stop:1131 length:426 start_codon:yes stop_codon:yes gene_type:complete
MPRPSKTFLEIFDEAKIRIAENTLTLKELSTETGVDEGLLLILLDQNNDVVNGISRLMSFMKINLHSNHLKFSAHTLVDGNTQAKIVRTIEPRCSMYYDKATCTFFRFKLTKKRNKITRHQKALIISDMKDFLEDSINKIR